MTSEPPFLTEIACRVFQVLFEFSTMPPSATTWQPTALTVFPDANCLQGACIFYYQALRSEQKT